MNRIPLSCEDISYTSMTKIGKIEVEEVRDSEIMIVVGGFEFDDKPTCRMYTIRAMSWLRDMLDAQIRVEQLANAKVFSAVD